VESRTSALSINLQELLNKNSDLIVSYLISEASKYKHIGLIFSDEYDTTRLFFPKNPVKKSPITNIEKLLKQEIVIASINQLFTHWDPILNKKNVETLSHYIDDFFMPIETSEAWQVFWKDQVKKIKKSHPENAENKIKIFHDLIIAAFFYKAICVWSKNAPDTEFLNDKFIKFKMEVFTKIAHANINDVFNYFNAKLIKEINKKLAVFLYDLPDIENNIDLTLKLNECIKSIKSMPLFIAIPNKEAILIDALQHTNKNLTSVGKMFNTLTNEAISNPLTNSTTNMLLEIPGKELKRKASHERKSIVPLLNIFENNTANSSQSSINLPQESLSSRWDHESVSSVDTQARITTITNSNSATKAGSREIQAFITTPVSYNSITISIKLNETSETPHQSPRHLSRKHSRKKISDTVDTKPISTTNHYENNNATLFSKSKSRKKLTKTSKSTIEEKIVLKSTEDSNIIGNKY
jgi:hypothetical protein